MGTVLSSHPPLPPSPMPHTTSGPPPRPILTATAPARAHTFYDIDIDIDDDDEHGTPLLTNSRKQRREKKKDKRRRAATWDIAPHSKVVSREMSPAGMARGMVQRAGTFRVTAGKRGGYVGLEGEKKGKENGGEWHNRMKVGKEGDVWFF